MPETHLTQDEKNARVAALLRQVDALVKQQKLDDALEKIRKVYEYDIKNAYARAYEERILVMMVERERAQAVAEAQKKAAEQIDTEVKRRLNEFFKQQELEALKRKELEKTEQTLEEHARKASVSEVQEVVHEDITKIETEASKRIQELEKKLTAQIQQVTSILASLGTSPSEAKIRAEYEAKLQQYKKQYENAEAERRRIHEETFKRIKDEQKRFQEELLRKMDQERKIIQEREREKAKLQEKEAYHNLMKLMMQLNVPKEVENSLLQSLRITFSIDDKEHAEIEHSVQVSAYIDAVRSLWQKGNPGQEDFEQLKNLQQLYKISDQEADEINKQVKRELGLPDQSAILLVIDDDISIRKYVEHILKKTYRTVIVSENAESALKEIEKTTPSLIICDVNLGQNAMSGFTFYEKIKAGTYGEKLKSVPFIMMSSLQDEFFIKTAQQMGIKAYLTKPFTREILESAVKNALT